MKFIRSIFPLLLGLPLLAPGVSTAQATSVSIDDRDTFPAELFPGIDELSDAEVFLHGLHALFPERIVPAEAIAEPEEGEQRSPLIREIGENVVYVRLHRLEEEDLEALRENLSHPVTILDVRYLSSDLDSAAALGAVLTRRDQFHFQTTGKFPLPTGTESGDFPVTGENVRGPEHALVTLSNHGTAGPVEVLLEQLREDGDIISVGAASRGRTASFRTLPSHPEWKVVRGELRPETGASLVENGFIPQVEIDVDSEEDRIAYNRLTGDVTIEEVIERRPAQVNDEDMLAPEDLPPPDLILQRALNIVKALQALGQIPG